jgi:hypothetical protein
MLRPLAESTAIASTYSERLDWRVAMGSILLWLLGIPIPIIILLALVS